MEPIVVFGIIFVILCILVAVTTAPERKSQKEHKNTFTAENADVTSEKQDKEPLKDDHATPQQNEPSDASIIFQYVLLKKEVSLYSLKDIVGASIDSLVEFEKIEEDIVFKYVDSVAESARTDYLHWILHLAAMAGGVTGKVSELISYTLSINKSPAYWNEYIRDNSLDRETYCYSIPLTLRDLSSFESDSFRLSFLSADLSPAFFTTYVLLGQKTIELYGDNKIKQLRSYLTFKDRLGGFISPDLGTDIIKMRNKYFNIIMRTNHAYNTGNAGVPSINYYRCPSCEMILPESVNTCAYCDSLITEEEQKKVFKIQPKHEETYYHINEKMRKVKILYNNAYSGRWLTQFIPRGADVSPESYYNSGLYIDFDEYRLSDGIYSNIYHRSGPFLYAFDKLCSGNIPFDSYFTANCYTKEYQTIYPDRFLFEKDGTVMYLCYDKEKKRGKYRRKGNLLILEMEDIETGTKTNEIYGIYRDKLCLDTCVEVGAYQKIISILHHL